MDGSWHIDRGVVTGLHGVLNLAPGADISIRDGIILDAVGGQKNPDVGEMPANQGLGFGAVGNRFDIGLKLCDPSKNGFLSMSINYQVKSWFVTNQDITYGPEYLISPSAIVQTLTANFEVRVF